MAETFQITKTSENGYRVETEFRNVPVAFVNAIRRILLSEIPTVVVRDVQILENTSHMIHEMLRHRVEMLPVNVRPDEAGVIRDTNLELRMLPSDKERIVTTNDFAVAGPRKDVLLQDRDLGTDLLFMNLKSGHSLHIKAVLGLGNASQVCVATYKNHIDETVAKLNKDTFVLEGGDARVFDNFLIQKSFSVDEQGRPNWFDFTVESIGVQSAKDLLKQALNILKNKVIEWSKTPVNREEPGVYSMTTDTEGHTIGNLAQQIMYASGLVDFVSYKVPHPMLPQMIVRFQTKMAAETVVERFREEAVALCESILKSM
jgi:DNA-directed RNA polymerase subunit L